MASVAALAAWRVWRRAKQSASKQHINQRLSSRSETRVTNSIMAARHRSGCGSSETSRGSVAAAA